LPRDVQLRALIKQYAVGNKMLCYAVKRCLIHLWRASDIVS